jgi:hypothetical protein
VKAEALWDVEGDVEADESGCALGDDIAGPEYSQRWARVGPGYAEYVTVTAAAHRERFDLGDGSLEGDGWGWIAQIASTRDTSDIDDYTYVTSESNDLSFAEATAQARRFVEGWVPW